LLCDTRSLLLLLRGETLPAWDKENIPIAKKANIQHYAT
jgi:hypothetical protein